MGKMKKDELVTELNGSFLLWDRNGRQNASMSSGSYTDALHPYNALFSPVSYNGVKAKNRVIYLPGENAPFLCEKDMPDRNAERLCLSLADGGTGVICTPPESVSLSAYSSASWRTLTALVHARGACIFAQLGFEKSSSLFGGGVSALIKAAAQSAANAVASGFDGICIKDFGVGGFGSVSAKSRTHGAELAAAVRDAVGASVPVLWRVSLSSAAVESFGKELERDKTLKHLKKQTAVSDTLAYMAALAENGVDVFETCLGCAETPWLLSPASQMPAGCYLDVAKAVSDYFRATGVVTPGGNTPFVAVSGRLGYPDIAEAALLDGMCQAVVLSDALEADNAWCQKAKDGACSDIIPPYALSDGCRFSVVPAPRRRTAVVGGGLGGMLYALEAARNGHRVTLYERRSTLGGELAAVSVPALQYAAENYLRHIIKAVENCGNITVRTGITADGELLAAENYESIVFAVGKRVSAPSVGGWGEIAAYNAADLLTGSGKMPELRGKKIAVLGGSSLACACARWLKSEKGCKRVTLMHDKAELMGDAPLSDRTWTERSFARLGIETVSEARIDKIKDGWLYYEKNGELKCVDPDLIVLADGKRDTALYEDALRISAAPEIILLEV